MSIKRYITLLLFALVVLSADAASNLYYGALRAESAPQAGGQVYAGTTNRTDTLATIMTSAVQSTETMGGEMLFYAYAQPSDGYSFLGWSDQIDGAVTRTENPVAIAVACLAKNSSAPTTDTIFAQFRALQSASITMAPPTMLDGTVSGSYTADYSDGTSYTVSTTAKQKSTSATVTLTAHPAAGTKLFGWQVQTTATTEYISYDDTLRNYGFTEDCTIRAVFCDANTPLWEIKGQFGRFADLSEAIAESRQLTAESSIVALVSGGVLHGAYTIPDSVCLLIPFDKQQTCYKETPGLAFMPDSLPKPAIKEFIRLTMASDANLTVKGELTISSRLHSGSGSNRHGCVNPYEGYGRIDMQAGAQITLQDSARLYCWGYITGEGEITANAGTKVYEGFQIPVYRGGNPTNTITGSKKHVFPINQYYIQNVEAPLTLLYGSDLQIFTSVTMDDPPKQYNARASYIGLNGLYRPAPGAVIRKHYDPLHDRQVYDITGDAELAQMELTIAGYVVNSEVFVMPITNNMDIRLHSGTTTVNHQLALLADASIRIDSAATLQLLDSTYIYDRDEWLLGNFTCLGQITPATYSPTCQFQRDTANLRDATLDVNGTLLVDSAFYTTKGGANICSTEGTGRIIFNHVSPAEDTTYQAVQDHIHITFKDIPCTSPKLRNADRYAHCAEYLSTIDADGAPAISAGDTIYNHNGHWGWMRSYEDVNEDERPEGYRQVYACFCALTEEALPDTLLPADFVPEKYTQNGDTCTFIQWTTERDAAMQQIVTTAEWNCPDSPIEPPVEDGVEDVEVNSQSSTVKIFREGQIIIRREDGEYTVLGVKL